MKLHLFPRHLLLLGLAILLGACEGKKSALQITGPTMGTSYSIKYLGDVDSETLKQAVDAELDRLNSIFSTYQDDTELSQLNRIPVGETVPVSSELAEVMQISRDVHALTQGAFEVTVGPVVDLWGFGPSGPRSGVPDETQIEDRLQQIGTDAVVSVPGEGITRTRDVSIDLSAVAKGYAVDQLSDLLGDFGIERYMIEVGGEIRTRGRNDRGVPWVIAIEKPLPGRREIHTTLPMEDVGMATSGDYRNFFTHEGTLYSHTIDPRTGWPVSHDLASVTVLHESAARADALATAFSVLGAEDTLRIADANNIRVLAIIRGDTLTTRTSRAMDDYLSRTKPSD